MVQKIKIKRSDTTSAPASLDEGELAYSSASGANKLFIGNPGSGSPATVTVIGGKLYVDMLDHTAGTLTASSAIIVDASSKIDVLNVDNVTINGNAITSTDVNGDLTLTPNGTGNLVLDGLNWPQADGGTDQFLKTNGAGQLSWATSGGSSFNISDGSSPTDVFNLGATLSFLGTANEVETVVTNDTVTFGLPNDVTIPNNLSVTGDLIVNGTTTTVNSDTVTIDDPIFTLGASSPVVDDNKDRGIEFLWNQSGSPALAKTGFFGHDDSSSKFVYIPDATNTSEVFSGTPGTFLGDFEVNSTFTLGGHGMTDIQIASEATLNDTSLMTPNAINNLILDKGYTTNTGTVTSVLGGTGVTSSGGTDPSISLDFSELTDMTGNIAGTTEFILQDGTTESRKAASEIQLSFFNNDSGWTSNTGDITQVTISSTDTSISGTGVGSSGDIAFDLEVSLVDGGTF